MRHRGALVAVAAGVIATLALGSTAAAFAVKSTVTSSKSATSTTTPRGGTTKGVPPQGARPEGPGGPGGQGRGGRGGMMGAGLVEVVSKLTGESTSTVMAARQSGKSFATIAKAKGVSVAQIVELASHAPKAALDSQVTDGLITKTQADTILADLKSHLTEEINETSVGHGHRGGPDGRFGPPPSSATSTGTPMQ